MTAARTGLDILFDRADLRCVVCGASQTVGCDCHKTCRCGWYVRKGETCRNPTHAREAAAEEVAACIAGSVIAHMRTMYPEPMRHASGGFIKTLRAAIRREAGAMVLAILETKPDSEGTEA